MSSSLARPFLLADPCLDAAHTHTLTFTWFLSTFLQLAWSTHRRGNRLNFTCADWLSQLQLHSYWATLWRRSLVAELSPVLRICASYRLSEATGNAKQVTFVNNADYFHGNDSKLKIRNVGTNKTKCIPLCLCYNWLTRLFSRSKLWERFEKHVVFLRGTLFTLGEFLRAS